MDDQSPHILDDDRDPRRGDDVAAVRDDQESPFDKPYPVIKGKRTKEVMQSGHYYFLTD
jgi:hypothetical protein